MNELEISIWNDAQQLYQRYAQLDLKHNAHGIFQLSFDAARCLIWKYQCNPLAYTMAMALVAYNVAAYEAAHQM